MDPAGSSETLVLLSLFAELQVSEDYKFMNAAVGTADLTHPFFAVVPLSTITAHVYTLNIMF